VGGCGWVVGCVGGWVCGGCVVGDGKRSPSDAVADSVKGRGSERGIVPPRAVQISEKVRKRSEKIGGVFFDLSKHQN
jgi:hypothetical protein